MDMDYGAHTDYTSISIKGCICKWCIQTQPLVTISHWVMHAVMARGSICILLGSRQCLEMGFVMQPG